MTSSESLDMDGGAPIEWAIPLGTYEEDGGTYRRAMVVKTAALFVVPIETGFSFIDNPEQLNNE